MKQIIELLARIFLPQDNACLLCGRTLWKQEHLLCTSCAVQLEKQRIPKEDARNPAEPAEYCLNAYYYGDIASKLVYLLKYDHVPIAAEVLGKGMADTAQDLVSCTDIIVPVPIHKERLRERGYNQAEKLAEFLSVKLSIPVESQGLLRTDSGKSLVGQSREERLNRLQNPFEANASLLQGKNILLTDDVYTTGKTVSQCAEALRNAGCGFVWAVTACRA